MEKSNFERSNTNYETILKEKVEENLKFLFGFVGNKLNIEEIQVLAEKISIHETNAECFKQSSKQLLNDLSRQSKLIDKIMSDNRESQENALANHNVVQIQWFRFVEEYGDQSKERDVK